MATEKDITYYARIAEKKFISEYADEVDVESKYALVDKKDDFCMFIPNLSGLSPTQLLFGCKKTNGEVTTSFVKDGKDKVTETLGLVDNYEHIERIDIEMKRKEDGFLHYELPEELRQYGKEFFKVKLLGLDDFVAECNYTGWGDCFTNGVLQVLGGIMTQDFIDFDKNEILNNLNYYVGPAEDDDLNYYAMFDFSHLEIAKDSDDDKCAWAIYVCYEYQMLEDL